MEVGFLLIVVAGAAAGYLLRRRVRPSVGYAFVAIGLGGLLAGVAVLMVAIMGGSNPRTSAFVAVLLLGIAALALPFGIALSWGRRSSAAAPPTSGDAS